MSDTAQFTTILAFSRTDTAYHDLNLYRTIAIVKDLCGVTAYCGLFVIERYEDEHENLRYKRPRIIAFCASVEEMKRTLDTYQFSTSGWSLSSSYDMSENIPQIMNSHMHLMIQMEERRREKQSSKEKDDECNNEHETMKH